MTHDTLAPLVVGALVLSGIGFVLQYRSALEAGRATTFAPPRGDARRGVLYAFTRGMDPRRKDGVRRHPMVLVAGLMFHAGIAVATLAFATLLLVGPVGNGALRRAFGLMAATGAAAGIGLSVRRLRTPMLAIISRADDFVSSGLVVTWLAATAATTLWPVLLPLAAASGIAMVLYAPFGKIRHCVFFFTARSQYGRFLGRRGIVAGTHLPASR